MITIYGKCELFNLEQDFHSAEEAMVRYEELLAKKIKWKSIEVVDRATMIIIAAKYR